MEVSTGPPAYVLLHDYVNMREDHGDEDLLIIPAFSMVENSAVAEANFSRSRHRVIEKPEDLEL